jgi:hypothetical protein
MPDFFIPGAENEEERDEIYSDLNKRIREMYDVKLAEEKIYRLEFEKSGSTHVAEVGEKTDLNDEEVIAILYNQNRKVYYICTPSRGVDEGSPLMAGEYNLIMKTLFEN